MMNLRTSLALLVLSILAAQDASAYVNFDDFQINLLDHRISTGDTLQVILRFNNPDRNVSVDADIEILLNDVPVFRDGNYKIDFTQSQDKTVTITSDVFPGPDMDNDPYNQNLMKYDCGEYNVLVRVSGQDFRSYLEENDKFLLGGDGRPLSLAINPQSPSAEDDAIITVYDDHQKVMKGMNVKMTWIDDPSADEPGNWDSEDKKSLKQTNSKGEAKFNLQQKFTKGTCGRFQVDAYGDRYCLSRSFFNVSSKALSISVSPEAINLGQVAKICAKGYDDASIDKVQVHISGPSYSGLFQTDQDGCINFVPQMTGDYSILVDKTCFEADGEKTLAVSDNSEDISVTDYPDLGYAPTDSSYPQFTKAASNVSTHTNGSASSDSIGAYEKTFAEKISDLLSMDGGMLRWLLLLIIFIAILYLLKNIIKQ
jgi:hypothetical protein